jgi:hypothetical protein
LKEGKKQPALSRSKAEAAHLDNLLDEALRETFPASDPIAIIVDKPSKSVAPPDELHKAHNPSTAAESQGVAVDWAPAVFSLFDANLWALRQISSCFDLVVLPARRSKIG